MNVNQSTGFKGKLSDIAFIPEYHDGSIRPIDLMEMARRSLSYLANNPLPGHGYECRFSIAPLNCPPLAPDQSWMTDKVKARYIDPISVGDTESRNDVAFNMMRMMTGDISTGREAQDAVHKRLLGYIATEGRYRNICWVHPFCMNCATEEPWAVLWTTGLLLQSECDLYRIDPANRTLDTAASLYEGIMNCAVRENGRAYHPAGMAPFDNEGRVGEAYRGHYPMVIGPLCEYWQVSRDERCLRFLYELAEGFLLDLVPGNLHRPDGGVDGHNHVQMHAIRGMAQFAYLTKEPRYLEWIKKAYEYYSGWMLDTGWLPEIRDLADHGNHSETCLNADIVEVQIWLALSGYVEMWDAVDRAVRNYFAPGQFIVNEAFEALYRDVNKDEPAREVEAGLDMLRALEGGFISALTPNDRVFAVRDGSAHWGQVQVEGTPVVFDMMGCCPPEGMRAIYYAWKYAVTEECGAVFIHLPYALDTSCATVTSAMPHKGLITARAKTAGQFHIRVPQWANRGDVKTQVNGREVPVRWSHSGMAYVVFECMLPGDEMTVAFPLLDMWQDVEIRLAGQSDGSFRYHWIGNSVVEALPSGRYLPLYQDCIY